MIWLQSNYRNAPELPKCPSKLPKCPMEKRNTLELGVLYYYKHFLKIFWKLVKKWWFYRHFSAFPYSYYSVRKHTKTWWPGPDNDPDHVHRYLIWNTFSLIFNRHVVEWSRALDVRLSQWCCSVSMVWVQIPSREEQKIDSSKI